MITNIRSQVNNFCEKIGRDRLLVQGAGGNFSWKDNGLIWIKASGKWLSKSIEEDIFVSLELDEIIDSIKNNNYAPQLNTTNNCSLRPSIETILHCLFPNKYVLHLHPVDIVAVLVKRNAKDILQERLGDEFKWGLVEYFKPGDKLARAVHRELIDKNNPKIVFLKNHGVVLAGENLLELEECLSFLIESLSVSIVDNCEKNHISYEKDELWLSRLKDGYSSMKGDLSLLATQPDYYSRIKNTWAICPDHVVYLGAEPIYINRGAPSLEYAVPEGVPFIFIEDVGVYGNKNVTPAQCAQLHFYLDVISRLKPGDQVEILPRSEILSLLKWDAEKYRVAINDV